MARKRLAASKPGSPALAGPTASRQTKEQAQREHDYRAEEDFRTLERAEEVRADAARHTRALGHGRKKVSAMSRILGKSGSGRVEKSSKRSRSGSKGRR